MRNETIICIAPRVWDSLWRDSQQLMSRISRQNRVLYFEPGRNPDRGLLSEIWRNWPNFFTLRTKTLNENLTIIQTPSSLPIMRQHLPHAALQVTTPLTAEINSSILISHVRRVMKTFIVRSPILWLYSPYHYELVGKFNEKLACYYNYDEFPEFPQNKRIKVLLRQFDNELSRRVDVIFATSRSQCAQRQTVNPHTYFSPNAVDFDLFNRALTSTDPLPTDIANLKRPIIGFVGWLGYHIDTELLLKIAQAFTECSLVLVGPDELPKTAALMQLRAQPNVFFLGRKELNQLPGYLQAFNVALLPYLLSEGHVLYAYPLKLHEYLAAGRSVVAVNLPELHPFNHLIGIAKTQDDFICLIRQALQDNPPEAIEARVATARENTWDHRVEDIYNVLQQHLPN